MLNRSFAPFPILATQRLILRQLSISDDHKILALRSDREVNRYLDRPTSKTLGDARNFIDMIAENIKNNHSIYWAITLADRETFAGTICLFDFSEDENKCEIGFELLPDFQGQGIMKEAIEKVIDYGIHKMNIQKIEGVVHKDNKSSIHLLGKLKFTKSPEPEPVDPNYQVFTFTHSD